MLNRHIVTTVVLTVAIFVSANGKDILPSSDYIRINLLSVTVDSTNSIVKASLQYNGNTKCLKVSNFSLEAAVRNCVLYDAGGVVSVLTPQGKDVIIDPPTFAMDYRTEMYQGRNTTIEFAYDGILPLTVVNSQRSSTFNGKYPEKLDYQIFGEVGVTTCSANSVKYLIVGGKGNVKLNIN